MTLGDLSNLVLTTGQQPGASYTVGGGGGPNWAALTNPQFSQGFVEFCINQGYLKAMGDLWDQKLTLVTFTLTSTIETSRYSIPPAGYSPIGHVIRVFYQPNGLPYSWEFRPGSQLISWDEFQGKYTGQGYLQPYAFGTQPMVCSIDPTLTQLAFYPGSAIAGDTITVDYQPIPSYGSTGAPLLTTQNATPLLPADVHMAIYYFAMHLFWLRAREAGMAEKCYHPDLQIPSLYGGVIKTAQQIYARKFNGDNMRVEPFMDSLGMSAFL